MNQFLSFLKTLGPGLMFAGAAVGTSHLIQSTRAGAGYGFTLMWAVLLILLFKYPFFEFGTRYTASKGETLLAGYKRMGKWVLWAYIILTPLTMFTIQAAVTLVTAGLVAHIFGLTLGVSMVSLILLLLSVLLLASGQYSVLDNFIKLVIVMLTVSTLVTVIFAVRQYEGSVDFSPYLPTSGAELAFLIALMGWMPAPVDMSVWSSLWAEAKQKSTPVNFSLRASLLDFNVGYWATLLIAIFFLVLGALVMKPSGESFSGNGTVFAGQLIDIYTRTLGDWSYWIISIAALTTMLSTTITCLDGLTRVMARASVLAGTRLPEMDDRGTPSTLDDLKADFDEATFQRKDRRAYWIWMVVLISGALLIIYLFSGRMRTLLDFATILSFLTTPFYAIVNYRLITSKHTPTFARPKVALRTLSILGIVFLTGFSLFYLWTLLVSR